MAKEADIASLSFILEAMDNFRLHNQNKPQFMGPRLKVLVDSFKESTNIDFGASPTSYMLYHTALLLRVALRITPIL